MIKSYRVSVWETRIHTMYVECEPVDDISTKAKEVVEIIKERAHGSVNPIPAWDECEPAINSDLRKE